MYFVILVIHILSTYYIVPILLNMTVKGVCAVGIGQCSSATNTLFPLSPRRCIQIHTFFRIQTKLTLSHSNCHLLWQIFGWFLTLDIIDINCQYQIVTNL